MITSSRRLSVVLCEANNATPLSWRDASDSDVRSAAAADPALMTQISLGQRWWGLLRTTLFVLRSKPVARGTTIQDADAVRSLHFVLSSKYRARAIRLVFSFGAAMFEAAPQPSFGDLSAKSEELHN